MRAADLIAGLGHLLLGAGVLAREASAGAVVQRAAHWGGKVVERHGRSRTVKDGARAAH